MSHDERLDHLEMRISELEKEVRELKMNTASKRIENEAKPHPRAAETIPRRETISISEKKETDWEHLIARVWLPRVFMFVLLIGLIWGFKAAVDGGYITEEMRCILGLLAGGAFIYLGRRQYSQKRPLLSQVLLGGSIGIFMLTTFAANYLYDFINTPLAFMLNVLWTALGLWFSCRYKSQALGVMASIAGVLTPFLVNGDNPSTAFFVAYEVLLYVSFMLVAMKQRFVILFYTSFILIHPAFLIYGLGAYSSERWLAYGVLIQHVMLLGAVLLRQGIVSHPLRVLAASFVLTALWIKLDLNTSETNAILLAFSLLYSALSVYFWKKKAREALPFSLAIASYALLFFTMNFVRNDAAIGLFMVEGFVALALGLVIRSVGQKINGLLIYLLSCLVGLAHLAKGMPALASTNTFIWIVLLGTLAGILVLLKRYPIGVQTKVIRKMLYYGLGLFILFFITDVTTALTVNVSKNVQHLTISSAWVGYAITVLAYGLTKGIKQVRLAGLALLFLTLMKVIFFDLPTVSIVIKAVLFIGLGGIGVLLSRFFYKKE
ncbi:DUF2339 domain-containing protein [Paenibacillus ferrarius]|uniref:DUF2339 domain-containing protein n=1 Tax=Paenibacillus ferrarius TaxID=1469647 RepID=UPI003D27BDAB